jgi:diguanylate cyclase (GGDEF)-like protein
LKKSSQNPDQKLTRDAIIGLGEASVRKNYYSELQGKIIDLERINARNRAILNTIPDVLMLSDANGNLTPFTTNRNTHNPFFIALMAEVKTMATIRESVKKCQRDKKLVQLFFNIDFNGSTHYMEARINDTEFDEFLIMIRDITETKTLENRLRHMADHDSLTGLLTRNLFVKKLLSYRDRLIDQLGIVVFDIDGLKMINDTLGHFIGDQVIKIVAEQIEAVFENRGFLSRLSGDEFGVLIEGVSESELDQLVKKVIENVDAVNERSDSVIISISFGYAVAENGYVDVDSFYSIADNHMYQNKMFKATSARSSIVKTLMKTLQAKDFITEGHADRMASLATALGERVNLSRHIIDRLHLLAKFHDIGKVGIPDNILNKPGRLDVNEFKVMKTHTHIGMRIALESIDLQDIAELIYHHHERWDGNGYPEGLSRTDIPIECRILSIVDSYDAMTNDRPYRNALTHEEAIEEIKKNAGSQFDPELVAIFCDLISKPISALLFD